MTSSDLHETLDRLGVLLSEQNLRERVDRSIDEALANLVLEYDSPLSPGAVLTVWGDFLIAIYENFTDGNIFDKSEFEEEAVALAEETYVGIFSSGYDAAIRDSLEDPPHGLALVIAHLAETIKKRERAKYIASTLNAAADPANRRLRTRLAREALERVHHLTGTAPFPFTDGELGQFWRIVILHFVQVSNGQHQLAIEALKEP